MELLISFLKKINFFSFLRQGLSITPLYYGDIKRLSVGKRVSLANTLFNMRSGNVKIGNGVIFGHDCMVLTGFHDYSKSGEDRERITVENANRNIVIEDSPPGIAAGKASGTYVVAVDRGIFSEAELSKADIIVNNLTVEVIENAFNSL